MTCANGWRRTAATKSVPPPHPPHPTLATIRLLMRLGRLNGTLDFRPEFSGLSGPDAADSSKQTCRVIIGRSLRGHDGAAAGQGLRELARAPAAQPSTLWLMQEVLEKGRSLAPTRFGV